MKVTELRNYGVAMSDAESYWPETLKKKMKQVGRAIVFSHLNFVQKIQFIFTFHKESRRIHKVDLSALRAKGMNNEKFIAQQREYIALFSALARVLDKERAVQILKKVMDATAKEAPDFDSRF